MEKRFEEKLQETREKIMDEVVSAATQLFEEHRQLLPPPKSTQKESAEEINDKMSRMKIEWRLEEQAIEEWTRLPESDRLRKVGLSAKKKFSQKRCIYQKVYPGEHGECFESRIWHHLGRTCGVLFICYYK